MFRPQRGSVAAHAVLTNAPLLRMVALFQRGLPRDMVELIQSLQPTSDDTLPRFAVRRQDLPLLERLWRYSQEQPEYFLQQPRLSFDGAWLESVRMGNVEITTWIDARPLRPDQVDAGEVWMAVTQSQRVAMVEYVLTRFPPLKTQLKEKHVTKAIKQNAADLLMWLEANLEDVPYPKHARLIAVNAGAIDVLKYLHERNPTQVWQRSVMDLAARFGQFETVRFLHEHRTEGCTTVAMDLAAARGHFEVVRFLHEHRSEGCTTEAMNQAAANGHSEVVQFLHQHRSEGCTTTAMDKAASNGHFEIVQFLHEHRSEGCTTKAMDSAAAHGYLDVVEYLHTRRSEGCTTAALDKAAMNGHLEVVKFLLDHRTEGYTPKAIIETRERREDSGYHEAFEDFQRDRSGSDVDEPFNHLRIDRVSEDALLQLMDDDTERTMMALSQFLPQFHRLGEASHFSTVQALHKQRTKSVADESLRELTEETVDRAMALFKSFKHRPHLVVEAAANKGDLAVVRFLHLHCHADYCSPTTCLEAAERGEASVVAFLLQHCVPSDSVSRMLRGAINSGDLATTQCVAERCTRDELVEAQALAARRGLEDIAEYLEAAIPTKAHRSA